MRRLSSVLLTGSAAAVAVVLLGASSAQVSPGSDSHPADHEMLLAAGPDAARLAPALPSAAPPDPTVELVSRANRATSEAQRNGADISFTLLDRRTGRLISSGDGAAFPIASVAKLFIADDLLTSASRGKVGLSPDDRRGLDVMLKSSDDLPADDFWARGGGNAVISRVTARYKLSSTTAPYDGNWWNTMSTTADLARYYDKLLDGSGGLPAQQSAVMLADLSASTPMGADGYPQRFGIPDGLSRETVAVKQGWMCCWGLDNQVHLSTGVIGPDHRYIIAIASLQPVDDATARNTVTQTLKTMFPAGRI